MEINPNATHQIDPESIYNAVKTVVNVVSRHKYCLTNVFYRIYRHWGEKGHGSFVWLRKRKTFIRIFDCDLHHKFTDFVHDAPSEYAY